MYFSYLPEADPSLEYHVRRAASGFRLLVRARSERDPCSGDVESAGNLNERLDQGAGA